MSDIISCAGQMIGWKVMRTNPEGTRLISGANATLSFPIVIDEVIEMPRPGIWMSLNKDYVLEHYRCHDHEALLCLSFSPEDLCAGNMTDQQSEFSVRKATLLSCTILPPED